MGEMMSETELDHFAMAEAFEKLRGRLRHVGDQLVSTRTRLSELQTREEEVGHREKLMEAKESRFNSKEDELEAIEEAITEKLLEFDEGKSRLASLNVLIDEKERRVLEVEEFIRMKEKECGLVENRFEKANRDLGRVEKCIKEMELKIELKVKEFEEGLLEKLRLNEELLEPNVEELHDIAKNVQECINEAQRKGREAELRVKEVEVAEVRVKERREEVERREREVESRERRVESRVKEVELAEMKVKEGLNEVQRKEREVELKERRIESKVNEVERKEREVELNERRVDSRVKEVELAEMKVNEGLNEVQRKEREVESKERRIESKVKEVESTERRFKERLNKIELKEEHLCKMEKLIEENKRGMDLLMKTSEEREEQLVSLQKSVEERERNLDLVSDELRRKERELQQQAEALELKREQLNSQVKIQLLENMAGATNAAVPSSEIDLDALSSPRSCISQGCGNSSSPCFVGGFQAASPGSGAGAPTLSGRQIMHRHIKQLISANLARRSERNSSANLSTDTLNAQTAQGKETIVQPARTDGMGRSFHTLFEERLQESPSQQLQDNDIFWSTPSRKRRQVVQDPTTTSADRPGNGTLWPGLTESTISGHVQNHQFSSTPNIGFDGYVSLNTVMGPSEYSAKEQLQSMVVSHLKDLFRERDLGQSTITFQEIARSAMQTVLAACNLEHIGSDVIPVLPPAPCPHKIQLSGGEDESVERLLFILFYTVCQGCRKEGHGIEPTPMVEISSVGTDAALQNGHPFPPATTNFVRNVETPFSYLCL